jgi:hypothetical protein
MALGASHSLMAALVKANRINIELRLTLFGDRSFAMAFEAIIVLTCTEGRLRKQERAKKNYQDSQEFSFAFNLHYRAPLRNANRPEDKRN